MRKAKGFTLVEIMIVVAIIILLAAIAIPNLLRARVNANEAAAIGAVKTIVSAAISYRSVNNAYPTNLPGLNATIPPYIDNVLAGGNKSGYSFDLTSADANSFTITAWPQTWNTTGTRGFFSDASGVLRAATGANATVASNPIE